MNQPPRSSPPFSSSCSCSTSSAITSLPSSPSLLPDTDTTNHHQRPIRFRKASSDRSEKRKINSRSNVHHQSSSLPSSFRLAQLIQADRSTAGSQKTWSSHHHAHRQFQSPVIRFLDVFLKTRKSRKTIFLLHLMAVLSYKWLVGLGGYSGKGSPPLFGDLEAQRHWMALTTKVTLKDWYSYDLEYWGLDYPPLTAYHSLILGYLSQIFNSAYANLRPPFSDRTGWGDLHERLIIFLRATVICTECLIWIPIVSIYHFTLNSPRGSSSLAAATATSSSSSSKAFLPSSRRRMSDQKFQLTVYSVMMVLLNPNLVLIDNGHFQYNSVMLGLALASVTCFSCDRDLLGAVSFILSLGFKQMALYYSPAMFAYLFGKCIYLGYPNGLKLFLKLALASTLTVLILFSPFILWAPFPQTILQILHRIFPLGRGLFEDKVANFWCALNVLVKLRQIFTVATLAKLAGVATLCSVLPGVIVVLWLSWRLGRADSRRRLTGRDMPIPKTIELLPLMMFNSSIGFYLFSFQVHEKSILLVVLPLLIIVSQLKKPSRIKLSMMGSDREFASLMSNVAIFSMWPLLRRDGLAIQYISSILLYNHLIGYNPLHTITHWGFQSIATLVTYAGMCLIHGLELLIQPPARLPDLYNVANLNLSFLLFGSGYIWSLLRLGEEAWSSIAFSATDEHQAPMTSVGEIQVSEEPSPTRRPPAKRASSLEPTRASLREPGADERDENKTRSVDRRPLGTSSRTLRDQRRLVTQLSSSSRNQPKKTVINSPGGDKLMNRLKNRLNFEHHNRVGSSAGPGGGSSRRLLTEAMKVGASVGGSSATTRSPFPVDTDNPPQSSVDFTVSFDRNDRNTQKTVTSQRKNSCSRREDEEGGEGEERRKLYDKKELDELKVDASNWSAWEIALKNSREEAIRRRRDEMRLLRR